MSNSRIKNISEFVVLNTISINNTQMGLFSHRLRFAVKAQKPGKAEKVNPTLWYLKRVENREKACIEVYSQELLRILNPDHPKTRVVVDKKGRYYIASKMVKDSVTVESYIHEKGIEQFNDLLTDVSGRKPENKEIKGITGLGGLTVRALYTDQVDLKFGNILINAENKLIQVDGGWSFIGVQHAKKNDSPYRNNYITGSMLNCLPAPGINEYAAYNWLDRIRHGQMIVDAKVTMEGGKKGFYQEVNEELLKIFLAPKAMYFSLANSLVGGELGEELYKDSVKRRDQIMNAAIHTDWFKKYLLSADAAAFKEVFYQQLIDYRLMGKEPLFSVRAEERAKYKHFVDRTFIGVQETARLFNVMNGVIALIEKGQNSQNIEIMDKFSEQVNNIGIRDREEKWSEAKFIEEVQKQRQNIPSDADEFLKECCEILLVLLKSIEDAEVRFAALKEKNSQAPVPNVSPRNK